MKIALLADEVHGVAFRFSGIDIYTNDQSCDAAQEYEQLLTEYDVVLITEAVADELPRDKLSSDLIATAPLVFILPIAVSGQSGIDQLSALSSVIEEHMGIRADFFDTQSKDKVV